MLILFALILAGVLLAVLLGCVYWFVLVKAEPLLKWARGRQEKQSQRLSDGWNQAPIDSTELAEAVSVLLLKDMRMSIKKEIECSIEDSNNRRVLTTEQAYRLLKSA
ncbi:MAG TPA: hypothetical protein VG649_00165 [Candidatus Angelobacter sp.]|nr:hypothetical protein [Candidatus Angelobacter sp.]